MIKLWPHQITGADDLRSGKVCALWWQMRTGKTLAAIHGTNDGDRLIVCPNSVKGVWVDDLKKYGEDAYVWGTKPFPEARPKNVIVNYEMVWRTKLLGWNWDSYIFDESLRLANIRTRLWAAITYHLQTICAAKRVVLLSGTPCPEGFYQLISQAVLGTGQYCQISDPWEALRTYYTYDDRKYHWVIDAWHKPQARKQLTEMGRSMTQEEAGITTTKLYRQITVPYMQHEERLWLLVAGRYPPATAALYAQSAASGRSPADGHTVKSAKLNAVVEYATDCEGSVVVMTRFSSTLEYLHLKIPKSEVIHGEDKGPAYRTKILDRFSKKQFRILIANVATVKVGLNLSVANTIIFAENSWSGETRIQAEERATLLGKASVEIVDFVTTGPGILGEIDSHILAAVRAKKDFNHRMLR